MYFFIRDKNTLLTHKRPNYVMAGLVLIVVLLLHGMVTLWLLQPSESKLAIKPLMIEVALLAAPPRPPEQAASTPIIQTLTPPKPAPKQPKKAPIKPPADKKLAVVSKPKPPKERPKPAPVAVATPSPMPEFPAFKPSIAPITAPPTTAAPTRTAPPKANAVAVAKPDEPITCVHCPKPEFPAIALRRNWQGSVKLKLQFAPDGTVQQVTVLASSGHELLDEKAVNDVKKWRFVAGKAGRFAVQTINFKFDH